ncbi:DUF882 domain-containing protein [Daeguia caeni]|uniref:Murein endopeptidase K n=1 Tax=Daeguia caeni TaxID=439612 RepID=A0ABV9H3G2_9HYPH
MNTISIMQKRIAPVFGRIASRFQISLCLAVAVVLLAFIPGQASAETRSLKLYYVHTGERAEIPFKKNGRFLPEGLKRLNVFLRDWRRNEPTKMDPRLFDLIWQVYQATGSREYITVVSAYRSPATNNMLRSTTRGVAKHSQHTLGRAMDFFIPGVPLAKLRAIGMRYQIGGVGYYPRSGSPFVHMDVGNVRHWPRMSRKELLALFPDGKTVHIPTDGRPLPGYEAALAMIEKRKSGGSDIMMASNASKPRKSKTLFAALFGGGADEEEDNNDASTPAQRPARAVAPTRRQQPAAPAVVPAAPVAPAAPAPQQRETMIAALPAREIPVPLDAPRPEPAQPAAAEAAPASAALAMQSIPVPGNKPVQTPAAQDAIAQIVAADSEQPVAEEAPATLTGFVPIPATRPDRAEDAAPMIAAVIPATRPARPGEEPAATGQDAIAAIVNEHEARETVAAANAAPVQTAALAKPEAAEAPAQKLALLPKKDEIGALIAPPEEDASDAAPMPVVVAPKPVRVATVARSAHHNKPQQVAALAPSSNTGVRSTAKSSRYAAVKAAYKPQPVVQPAALPGSEIAMSTASVARVVPVTNPILRNDALRAAPTMVYTNGFQHNLPSENANQFKGKAVTFLSVAKFSTTN